MPQESLLNSHLKNDTKVSTPKGGFYGHAYFVLCGSCFWCASDLSGGSKIKSCPSCSEDSKIESMPLAPKEKYTFDFDPQRGIVLDFAPLR
jgi:hypothetical protein